MERSDQRLGAEVLGAEMLEDVGFEGLGIWGFCMGVCGFGGWTLRICSLNNFNLIILRF